MLIGILSDSHGEIDRTRKAMRQLVAHGCTKFIHLGDVEIVEVLDELIGFDVSLVFGNCGLGCEASRLRNQCRYRCSRWC